MGPNVKKLIAHKMALDAIPPSTPPGRGLATGLAFLLGGGLSKGAREATKWVEQAIAVIKAAPGNPFGDDDEAIAGEILKGVEERKKKQRA